MFIACSLRRRRRSPRTGVFGWFEEAAMFVLVRHAHAVSKRTWTGDDGWRPLSERGLQQAWALVDALSSVRTQRLLSSPMLRCRQTLEPLARRSGIPIEETPLLAPDADVTVLSLSLRTQQRRTRCCAPTVRRSRRSSDTGNPTAVSRWGCPPRRFIRRSRRNQGRGSWRTTGCSCGAATCRRRISRSGPDTHHATRVSATDSQRSLVSSRRREPASGQA